MPFERNFEVKEDHGVIDEVNNTFIAFREVSWYGNEPKLELRKWNVDSKGNEVPNKGFSFLTEDGPHNLAETLVEKGYGDTKVLQGYLDNRSPEDGRQPKQNIEEVTIDEEDSEEDYYDPNMILA